jgi:integrase
MGTVAHRLDRPGHPKGDYGHIVPTRPLRAHLDGRVARNAKSAKTTVIWDADLKGFGLLVRPSGTKSWIIKFTQRRVQKKLTLGSTANMTVQEARRKAKEILLKKALDGLPATRPTVYSPTTFGDYVGVFWADYARHWKPLTQYSNWGRIQRDLVPVFGNTPLADISRAQVLRWRDELAARPATFNRALPVLAVMMTYAEQLGLRPTGSNPCKRMPRYLRQAVGRYLRPAEYRQLGEALSDMDEQHPEVVAIIRLLMFTGARLAEIRDLRWDNVQSDRLRLADSKTGPKYIYLNRQARAVLEAMTRGAAQDLVFPASLGGHRRNMHPIWYKIRRMAALPNFRLHDLRHSFASVAIGQGISLLLIGRMLGHALPETTARYAHLDDGFVGDAAVRVSRTLGRAVGMVL